MGIEPAEIELDEMAADRRFRASEEIFWKVEKFAVFWVVVDCVL